MHPLKYVYVVYVLFDVGGSGTTEQIGGEFPTFKRCAQYLYHLQEPEPGWLKRPPKVLSCERKEIPAQHRIPPTGR